MVECQTEETQEEEGRGGPMISLYGKCRWEILRAAAFLAQLRHSPRDLAQPHVPWVFRVSPNVGD